MVQATLVDLQLREGQRLLDRLAQEGVPVTVAAWVKESESGDWYLYLATPLVAESAGKRAAYHRVNEVIGQLQEEGFGMDPFAKKVIGPTDLIARDLIARGPPWRSARALPGESAGGTGRRRSLHLPAAGERREVERLWEMIFEQLWPHSSGTTSHGFGQRSGGWPGLVGHGEKNVPSPPPEINDVPWYRCATARTSLCG
jgi:hypothetical protein